MKAELDYFKSAEAGKLVKGRHHSEWRPAKGMFEDFKEKPKKVATLGFVSPA
jgi:hypothetical protein